MSVRSTTPIMRSSPVQVIPMETQNSHTNPTFSGGGDKEGPDGGRGWTPRGARNDGKYNKL